VFICESREGFQGRWSRSSRYLLIGTTWCLTWRYLQRPLAWNVFSSLVTPVSGMIRAVTFCGPSASESNLSVRAESIPPESPRTAFVWPEVVKYFLTSAVMWVWTFCGFFMCGG